MAFTDSVRSCAARSAPFHCDYGYGFGFAQSRVGLFYPAGGLYLYSFGHRTLPQYIGLTIEEARALTAKETARNIFWPPVRGEAIWKALDEAEKKLRELQAEQERIRRLRSLHIEEPADRLWEEE